MITHLYLCIFYVCEFEIELFCSSYVLTHTKETCHLQDDRVYTTDDYWILCTECLQRMLSNQK